ncbi:MAG: hypothetical protein DWH91_02005 [Planctomycetota bacterium]|nr:MAG: hypothetical protein DWH91_02005 [Planctomycetota bacterium]
MNPQFLPALGREFSAMFAAFGMVYALILGMVTFVVHLLLMIGVYREASDRVLRGRKMWFVGPFAWAFLAMIGGVMTAGVYWVLHHSTFSPASEDEE